MLEQAGLVGAALLMGLAGGPHCVAMCGAPAAGVIRLVRAPSQAGAAGAVHAGAASHTALLFHAGRLASYAAAGAAVAGVMQALDLAGQRVSALQPLMVLLHATVLAWGLILLVKARQPAWAHGIGHSLMRRLQAQQAPVRNALVAGGAWVLMPCGLLYSALALASLGNGPAQGGMVMLAFGVPGALALASSGWLYQRLRARMAPGHERWFARAAGAMLVLLALDALWMDIGHQWAEWCA
ncbi:sulfite exporter TauE/SafE family protein [Variovorax dokdonensis]|uniref:Sulfite exporter TauE/SafE family protein n=1 Tax=Variovorax dokdonensis TaxID=344883 RepID=A0ABT7NAZ6_9BURK|nr:sulfite exporter TauE/SafE family protein [Variovorax dokdonensis]MDM0045070.1 sulfite exporter TauE/SafE family protein [Variovorax dokdonensis]